MRLAVRTAPAIVAIVLAPGSAQRAAVQAPSVPDLLAAAASYVATYEERAAGIVVEEEYVQQVRRLSDPRLPIARRTRSELVVLSTADFGWIGFRNVLQVDGTPVADSADRLATLFAMPVTQALIGRARAVADESARYNLGGVQRNWNYPTMPLMFLREDHQRRSRFTQDGSERVNGVPTWRLRFEEVARPTLIGSGRNDVAASGRFWVESDRGHVRRAQLSVREARSTGTIDVTYASSPGIDVLVPLSMNERIDARPLLEEIRGEARYSNFKQFTVEVESRVRVDRSK